MKKQTLIFIILFILGFVLGWIFFGGSDGVEPQEELNEENIEENMEESMVEVETNSPSPSTPINIIPSTNNMHVEDQPAGTSVTLKTAGLTKASWIAIYEDNNENLGNILGAGRFQAGTTENATVELLRATESGKPYHAVIHTDDGDDTFDHVKDFQYQDASGNLIITSFQAL